MSDEAKVQAIRAELPATQRVVYLNTGSAGPLSRQVADLVKEQVERETVDGRIGLLAHQQSDEARKHARAAVASVVGVTAEEIALTQCTTEGLNIALWGLPWRAGDELVTTNLEHPAVYVPAEAVARRFGAAVRYVDLGLGGGNVVGRLRAALGSRTRLLVLSHVSYCTGAALPLAEICALAAERGVLTLVDGAQAVGAVPLDLGALGVDFYAMAGQKWLLGPEGTGALYVRRERWDTLQQVFVGYASMAQQTYGSQLLAHPDARRYEVGLRNTPTVLGQAAAVEWLRDHVGLDWAQARIRRLSDQARESLSQQPNVKVLTPDNAGGLLMFVVSGLAPDAVVEQLAQEGIVVRAVKTPDCIRAAFGFYNTEAEIRRLAQAVGSLRPS